MTPYSRAGDGTARLFFVDLPQLPR